MARQRIDTFFDLSDREQKRRLLSAIGSMSGMYEVTIIPRKPTRSVQQNRWYFGCICKALAEYLSDQDYDVTTAEDAHSLLKARFLAVSVVNRRTREVLGRRVRSTTELTTDEMSDYCERCRAWLADFFNIVVPDPDPDWRSNTAPVRKRMVAAS